MSSLFDRKKIIPRYKIIGYVMVVLGLLIVGKAFYIATVKRDYWMQVADRLKRDSVDVKPYLSSSCFLISRLSKTARATPSGKRRLIAFA